MHPSHIWEKCTEEDIERVGQTVKTIRLNLGLTRKEFANKANVMEDVIKDIEYNVKIPFDELEGLLAVLNCKTVDQLIEKSKALTSAVNELGLTPEQASNVKLFISPEEKEWENLRPVQLEEIGEAFSDIISRQKRELYLIAKDANISTVALIKFERGSRVPFSKAKAIMAAVGCADVSSLLAKASSLPAPHWDELSPLKKEKIAKAARDIRNHLGITQKDLANKIGSFPSIFIIRLENGQDISFEAAKRILSALDCKDIEELFDKAEKINEISLDEVKWKNLGSKRKEIGEAVKVIRNHQGFTLSEIADKSECSASEVSSLETGKNILNLKAKRIFSALGCSDVDDVLRKAESIRNLPIGQVPWRNLNDEQRLQIGNAVNRIRVSIPFSKADLCKKAECNTAYISNIELGKSIPEEKAKRIFAVLGCSDVNTLLEKAASAKLPLEPNKQIQPIWDQQEGAGFIPDRYRNGISGTNGAVHKIINRTRDLSGNRAFSPTYKSELYRILEEAIRWHEEKKIDLTQPHAQEYVAQSIMVAKELARRQAREQKKQIEKEPKEISRVMRESDKLVHRDHNEHNEGREHFRARLERESKDEDNLQGRY